MVLPDAISPVDKMPPVKLVLTVGMAEAILTILADSAATAGGPHARVPMVSVAARIAPTVVGPTIGSLYEDAPLIIAIVPVVEILPLKEVLRGAAVILLIALVNSRTLPGGGGVTNA